LTEFVDAGTLVFMLSLGTMAFGGALLLATHAGDRSTRFWAMGFLLGGAGLLLLLLRGLIPLVMSIQVGNTVMLAGVACMVAALALYAERSGMLFGVALWFLASAVIFNVSASPPILAPVDVRVMIIAVLVATSQLLAVVILWKVKVEYVRLLNLLRASHIALGLAFLARFVYIAQANVPSDLLDPYPFDNSAIPSGLFFMAAIFLAFVQGPTFVLLKKEEADRKALEARERLTNEVAARWAESRVQAAQLQDARADTIEHFARGVAHDANNILGVLQLGYGEVAEQVKRHEPVRPAALELMGTALDQARVTTSGLMALGGHQAPALEEICIEAMVGEVGSMLESTLPVNIQLEQTTEPSLVGYTHRGFLVSALFNLAANARDAMPQGGVLRLATRHRDELPAGIHRIGEPLTGPMVDIAIGDEGPGIEPEVLDRIFQPMFTTRDHKDGHGYGLYMVQGVVERTGAALVVDSTPGRGTTMHLLIKEVSRG